MFRRAAGLENMSDLKKDITILAIESSCDETAASVVVNGRQVLSNVISSQIDIHTLYGGVVPEIASRKHTERVTQVIRESLEEAGRKLEKMDAIAVTYGPGLVGPLLIGVSAAKGLSFATGIPPIGVHHIEGHISANYIAEPTLEPPFACLVVSGGHTHLVLVRDYGEYEILGRTQDDAAGEAFDKVAREIGLGYPGGPKIDKASREGDPHAIVFPRGKAVVDVLVSHAGDAIEQYGLKKFALAGGVAANTALRTGMKEMCAEKGAEFFCPPPVLCTDNAAMIGSAAYFEYVKGNFSGLDLNAVPGLRLGKR